VRGFEREAAFLGEWPCQLAGVTLDCTRTEEFPEQAEQSHTKHNRTKQDEPIVLSSDDEGGARAQAAPPPAGGLDARRRLPSQRYAVRRAGACLYFLDPGAAQPLRSVSQPPRSARA
jgi:hypothetical protein